MPAEYDLICLSHLRWDFVYQRPQHLIGRFAPGHRTYFIEEPMFDSETPRFDVSLRHEGVHVVVPHLPHGPSEAEHHAMQRALLFEFMAENNVNRYVFWYYSPMFVPLTDELTPLATVYDCMDELSQFADAPPALHAREARLFAKADLVFTGGQSLYEAKCDKHPAVYAFPSSVDVAHFAKSRTIADEPSDQAAILHPRLGFYGVIDERLDVKLLGEVANLRPDYQWVILGPTVSKIDPATLPKRPNIHYLGMKTYAELPAYLAGWDAALLPFARNASTKFISPTKTPEYLAAGKPVVSTSITDVVRPYGDMGLVQIADSAEDFAAACDTALGEDKTANQQNADKFLAQMSWDKTWGRMADLIDAVIAEK